MSVDFFSTILPFPPKVINRFPKIYSNDILLREEKIILEKRRRNYTYKTLDYILSNLTYFDFFSIDAFEVLKQSQKLADFYKLEEITLDILFLSFFHSSSELNLLFEEYEINIEELTEKFESYFKENNTTQISFLTQLQNFGNNNNKVINYIDFSEEVLDFFEKVSEISLSRFKTPIITIEILFFILLERDNNFFGKIMESILEDSLKWELFKYKIIRRIHKEESALRDQVAKNQYYFAYLLKTQLTNNEYHQLISNEMLSKGVELFRNTLIVQLLDVNFFKLLELDIYKSMVVSNSRKYSL
jgi:hypothetical protein